MKDEIYEYQNSDIDEIIGSDIENSTEYIAASRYMIYLIKCALHGETVNEFPKDCTWKVIYRCITDNNVQGLTHYAVANLPCEPDKNDGKIENSKAERDFPSPAGVSGSPGKNENSEAERREDNQAESFHEMIMPKSIADAWNAYLQTVIYKQLMMTEEREEILSDLSQEGFSFLMFKGENIARYYPEPGMRDMSDNDILYGLIEQDSDGTYRIAGKTENERGNTVRESQKILLDYMTGRGYTIEESVRKDDVCVKEPMYVFEMHRALMDNDSPHLKYYLNPWKWAVKNEDSDYKYHYPVEDEYIYMLAHEFKHYSSRGCGIRFVADLYVFLEAEEKKLDWDYVLAGLEELGLKEFEQHMRALCQHAFEKSEAISFDSIWNSGKLSTNEEKELLYMCKCGTFGIDSTLIKHRVKGYAKDGDTDLRRAKRSYYLTRIFPPDDFYKMEFPFFYKHRAFRPLLTVYRFFKGIFTHFSDLVREVKIIRKMK